MFSLMNKQLGKGHSGTVSPGTKHLISEGHCFESPMITESFSESIVLMGYD